MAYNNLGIEQGGVTGGASSSTIDAMQRQAAAQSLDRGGMTDDEWGRLQAYKSQAQQMMSGVGIPGFNDLYKPLERSVNQGAFNLAGSQAADLAKRGLSRSGMQSGSIRDVEQGRATNLASDAASVTQNIQTQKDQAFQTGQNAMGQADDYLQQRKNLLLAKEQGQAWAQSYSPPPFATFFDRPATLTPQTGADPTSTGTSGK